MAVRHSVFAQRSSLRLIFAGAAFGLLNTVCLSGAEGNSTDSVFHGPVADYESVPPGLKDASAPAGLLRWVWVQERMGIVRQNAPVRVPVFFAAGECRNPEDLALVRWPSREMVSIQADDVRRGADDGVARLHLWFTTTLAAGENQRWALIRRPSTTAPAVGGKSVEIHTDRNRLQIRAQGTTATFFADAAKRGPFAKLELEDGPVLDFPNGVGATARWTGGAGPADAIGPENGGAIIWGTGPVFAKVIFKTHSAQGSELAQAYRLFNDGTLNIVQTVTPADSAGKPTLATQDFLHGGVAGNDGLAVRSQSAVVVDSLIGVHPGFVVDTLNQKDRSSGWLIVPGALGGSAGRLTIHDHREFSLHAPGNLTRDTGDARAGAVQAFWAEVTFVPARRVGEQLDRAAELAAGQPLVGVVERPGLTRAMAMTRLQDNVREIKPVGWVNETAIRSLQGKPDTFPRRKWAAESDPAFWVAGAQRAAAKVTNNGSRPPSEFEKGRVAGSLDPYHITYGMTALVHWLSRSEMPEPALKSLRAQLEAVRRQLGRTDELGWPYLDVFFRTQNMQMGPPLLTLADAGATPALRQYYRDQLSAPTLAAVMLRGLRPYAGRPQIKPEESDTLYQGVVDFMMRVTELSMNESLGLQPVAFGRYLDAIDVNADLYHPALIRPADAKGQFARANFFRSQSHLHRWLAWGPAPFIALLQALPEDDASSPGATEAWYFANTLAGHWKNWADQSWMYLASVLPEKAGSYSPPLRPATAKISEIKRSSGGNRISWEKQNEAAGYRVYRMRPGSPPVWLDSPYRGGHPVGRSQTEWQDTEGKRDDNYLVHVVNAAGHESAW